MLDLDRLEALCEIARAPLTARTRRRVTLAKEASDVLDALPALIAELRRLRHYIKIVPFLAAHGLLDYTNDSPTLACGSCGAVVRVRYNGECMTCATKAD